MTPFSSWPFLAALVFVAMGAAFAHASWRKYRHWPRVSGTVVALVRVAVLKVPEIEYRDAAGITHRFVSRMPYHQRLKVGQAVEVAVDPDDGAQAERVNVITAVVTPFLMVAFGVIVILFWLGVTRS